ncbi:MAG: hypothetical protein JW830_07460 [Bacteroidales bacterium]|nr:hypothetical protein [Bacteroidales bacterium]
MKTTVRLISLMSAALVILAVGFGAKAENSENVILVTLPNNRVAVSAENPQKKSMFIEFLNSLTSESVYYGKLSNDEHFEKFFDLSNLPEGLYTINISVGNMVYEKQISLLESRTLLLAQTQYAVPAFYHNDRNLKVTIFNPRNEDINISFWRDSESFFSDNPKVKGTFERKYNLKNLDPGVYSVEVTAGSKYYSHSFEIR